MCFVVVNVIKNSLNSISVLFLLSYSRNVITYLKSLRSVHNEMELTGKLACRSVRYGRYGQVMAGMARWQVYIIVVTSRTAPLGIELRHYACTHVSSLTLF